jgi:pilus assembly protein CpaC
VTQFMIRLLRLLPIALVVSPLLAPVSSNAAGSTRQVKLSRGTSASTNVSMGGTETMQTNVSYVDLVVGDPEIADVMPLTDRSFYVHGKKLGTTSVSAFDANKTLVGRLEIEVGYNTSRLRSEFRKRIPGSNVEVSSINGRIMLSGSVTDAGSVDRAMTLAKQFGTEVINNLTVSQPQQVMLEVRFVEASRNAGKALGVKWDMLGKNVSGQAGQGSSTVSNNTPFGSILGHFLGKGIKADLLVQALEDKGLARRLAEPNLVAMSGQSASFLAGGEFPFPMQGDQGRVSIEFKKFGVGLTFTPVVLANGVISLKIEPEVSQLDTTNYISVGGVTVPSLIVRRASTNVELRDGQSYAIAGLLQSVTSENTQQLPWLGDVPILGSLFRSSAFERKETDLAIIVTPRLVQPAKPGQKLRTPLDSTVAANDVDLFLFGQHERKASEQREDRGLPARVASGHILDVNKGDDRAKGF